MLQNFLDRMKNSFLAKAVSWLYLHALMLSGLIIFLGMVAEVFMRYIFKMNLFGIDEIILCFAIWFYFLGGVHGSREDSQIRADIVSFFFKNPKSVWRLRLVSRTIEIVVTLFLTIMAYDLIAVNAVRMPATQGLKIPLIVPQFAILIGWTLMSIYNIGHQLQSIASPEWKHADEEQSS